MKLVALLIATSTIAQLPSIDTVIARLDQYLAAYEPKLSELIADETMLQEVRGTVSQASRSDASRGPRPFRLRREIESEVAFIALPENAGWLGFRHVKAVNNKPVALGDSSLTASLRSPGFDMARSLLNASAHHNLGLPRTTNLPNLPLEFLHQRNRRRLLPRADGRERVRGVDTVRLLFLERMTPTLIKNPNGSDMPSVVRAWVDPRNGRLLRAEVTTFTSPEAKEFENRVRVEFGDSKALGLLVPLEMREVFPVERPATGAGDATYSNFRRFQTSARIVPQ
jgi:hypothetical protein